MLSFGVGVGLANGMICSPKIRLNSAACVWSHMVVAMEGIDLEKSSLSGRWLEVNRLKSRHACFLPTLPRVLERGACHFSEAVVGSKSRTALLSRVNGWSIFDTLRRPLPELLLRDRYECMLILKLQGYGPAVGGKT